MVGEDIFFATLSANDLMDLGFQFRNRACCQSYPESLTEILKHGGRGKDLTRIPRWRVKRFHAKLCKI